jgi:PKD repeat protein
VLHSFASAGTYNVTLTVEDRAGNTANLTQTAIVDATVPNSQPVAIIDYRPSDPAPSETIQLDASDSYDPDALIDRYRWDTDNDGEWEATGPTHNVSYDSPGIYTVRLEVRDERGATNVTSVQIDVGAGQEVETGWSWDAKLVDPDDDGNKTIEVSINTAPNTTLSNVVVEIHEYGNPSNRFPNYSLGEVNSAFITQDLGPNESEKSWVVVIHATQSDGDRVSDQIILSPRANTTPTQLPGWMRAGLSFIVLLLSAGLFSRINFGAGAVVIALEGGILWWTGWLTGMTTGAAVGFAMFIAIISYIQQRSTEARL